MVTGGRKVCDRWPAANKSFESLFYDSSRRLLEQNLRNPYRIRVGQLSGIPGAGMKPPGKVPAMIVIPMQQLLMYRHGVGG